MGLDIPEGSRVERTHAGRWQKSAGAWSWYLLDAQGAELRIGSQSPIASLLRERLAATRSWGHHADTDIDPVTAHNGRRTGWALYLEEPDTRTAQRAVHSGR
jgi:hypothetical protein